MQVMVNERGQRIGEGHRRAVLTDAEVEQLLEDRGPEDAPKRSYAQLAQKWKISKSSVRDICKGRRRGQKGMIVERPAARGAKADKVELRVRVALKLRAIVRRKGGAEWLEKAIEHYATHTAKAAAGAGFER